MAISNKENLSYPCYLTEIGGVKVLKKVFLKRVIELKPDTEDPDTWSVDRFLNMNKEKIESAKLTRDSMLIIFPVGGNYTNFELWDFCLFFSILKETCSLSPSMQKNLHALKKIHEKITYSDDLNISDAKYEDYFAKLRYIFKNTLNELNDMALQENITEMLQKSYAGQVPENELSKALLARQRNFEERKHIHVVKAEHYETRQQIERGNRELMTKLQELLTRTNFGYSETTIPVKIKSSQPDIEKHLQDSLVDMFNNEIKNIPGIDSTDVEWSLKESVHTFYKTLKEKGYEIVKAEEGCVLLHIQFSSVVSLLSFYFDYLRGDLDKYLDCLQKASRDFLSYQELQLEIVLYKDDFQQALSNIQDHGDWIGNRRLASCSDYNQIELFEKDWDLASILLTVKPPPNFERVELKQLIIAGFKQLSKASTFTLKNLKRIYFADGEDTPKKFKTNGKKSDPLMQLRSRTDGYPDGETERYDCTKTRIEKTLRHFVVPSENYRRYYYTYNNAQQIAKKYGHIIRSFGRSNEFALPCFDEVNIIFFSGDASVDLSVVDDAYCENVKEFNLIFDSIEEIAREFKRSNENAVSIFVSTGDIAEHLDFNQFNPHIKLVDDDKLKNLRFEEMQNVKESSRQELAKTINSLLEDMLLKPLVKMTDVLEYILGVHGPSSTRQEASVRNSVSTDFLSENDVHWCVTQSNTTGKKEKEEAQELYEDILALFYRTGKNWKSTFEDMVKTLDNEIAKELLQVPGVTSVGYKLAVLNLFLDDSMGIKDRQLTETCLKRLLKKHNISRYEFHYEQGKLQQYAAEVGSVLKAGERAGALGCFAKLGKTEEMCVLFSKHVSLGGNSLLVEHPPKSGNFMRFATLISSNTPDSDPLDIALAKVLKDTLSCQVKFKDEFGKFMPSSVCLFENTIWLNKLPVHISRAAGSPGLGIIIIPVLNMENAQTMYLKIEDRDVNARFANPGDSGAIVCANDYNEGLKVHVIAMLMGSSNDKEVNQRPETKRQYVAFRLIEGVRQLKRELNEDINLY